MAVSSYPHAKPAPSYNFVVYIDELQIPFSKVSSIEISIETEAFLEGGENLHVHSLSKPYSAEKTLTFERSVDTRGEGALEKTLGNSSLRVGACFKSIIISVLDRHGKPQKAYVAFNAILKKRSLSDLNAMSGEVFVESMEFIYEDLTEIPGVSAMFK